MLLTTREVLKCDALLNKRVELTDRPPLFYRARSNLCIAHRSRSSADLPPAAVTPPIVWPPSPMPFHPIPYPPCNQNKKPSFSKPWSPLVFPFLSPKEIMGRVWIQTASTPPSFRTSAYPHLILRPILTHKERRQCKIGRRESAREVLGGIRRLSRP